MDPRTKVYFTVDVECAEERHRKRDIQPALGYDLRVWGRLENRARPLGIELIMDELESRDFRGTFYVEPLAARSFGEEGLRDVTAALRNRGHDVQLHLHPVLENARWYSQGGERPDDDIANYPVEDQTTLLNKGLDILERTGIEREKLCSYRAGNFGASSEIWRAMKDAGLTLSSNYNPCYFDKNCRMSPRDDGVDLFRTGTDGVWELPITNFIQPNGRYRHLQLRAATLREMIQSLEQCHRQGIRHACVVAHSFEFFFIDDPFRGFGHPDRVTLRRFRGLLDFLQQRPEFHVETVGELGRRLRSGEQVESAKTHHFPREGWLDYGHRLIEQGIKRAARLLPR